ncbi:MAG: hypothetical protein KGN77_01885 [Xanthomonadaceae bacterium]|nr:hypothetical protein [Xanthomonadaceae bacterium]
MSGTLTGPGTFVGAATAWRPSAARTIAIGFAPPPGVRTRPPAPLPLVWPNKDPGETLDFSLDCTAWLDDVDDVIVSATAGVGAPYDLVAQRTVVVGPLVVVWLAGGTSTQVYAVTVDVHTAGGRTLQREAWITVLPNSLLQTGTITIASGPAGPVGPAGPQGAQGPQGPAGTGGSGSETIVASGLLTANGTLDGTIVGNGTIGLAAPAAGVVWSTGTTFEPAVLGTGLAAVGNTLDVTLAAGAGITVSGDTIANAGVVSVAGRTGAVTLGSADVSGLGTMASQNANAVAITGGSVNVPTLELSGVSAITTAAIPASDTLHLLGASGTAGLADAVAVANGVQLAGGTVGLAPMGWPALLGNFGTTFELPGAIYPSGNFTNTGTVLDLAASGNIGSGAVSNGHVGWATGGGTAELTATNATGQVAVTPGGVTLPSGSGITNGGALNLIGGGLSGKITIQPQDGGTIAANDASFPAGAAGQIMLATGTAWNQAVASIGSGLSLDASNTLHATGLGGTVTQVVAGTGLAGGTITGAGTISLGTIAADTVLANTTGAGAVPVGVGASAVLDLVGATQGDVLYRGATGWAALGPGTAGQVFQTAGASANPAWANVSKPTATVFNSSGSWTPKSTSTFFYITISGGGGGGGGGASATTAQTATGGGGGGGGAFLTVGAIATSAISGALTITVGANGTGGAAGSAGTAGGSSYVTGTGFNTLFAGGGGGGGGGQIGAGCAGGGGGGAWENACNGTNGSGTTGGSPGTGNNVGFGGSAASSNNIVSGFGGSGGSGSVGGGGSAGQPQTSGLVLTGGASGGCSGVGVVSNVAGSNTNNYAGATASAANVTVGNGLAGLTGYGSGGTGGTGGASGISNAAGGTGGVGGGPGGGGGGGGASAGGTGGTGGNGATGQVIIYEW